MSAGFDDFVMTVWRTVFMSKTQALRGLQADRTARFREPEAVLRSKTVVR